MNEQILTNSTDIENTSNVRNYIPIYDLESNKLDIFIEQSILSKSTNGDPLPTDYSDHDDSFDDEDEIMPPGSSYLTISPISSTYPLMNCPICLESSVLESTSCCKFLSCHHCWHTHISTAINDGRIQISCASNDCNKYLSRDIIISFIRDDLILYERYLKLYANVNQNPRAKTCKYTYII